MIRHAHLLTSWLAAPRRPAALWLVGFSCALAVFACDAPPTWAQEEDAEVQAAEPADDAPAEDAPAPRKPKPKPSDAAETAPQPPDDPAVLAVLESHPKTPAELLRAIGILTDLGHPALAKPFVEALVEQKLTPEAKAALLEQHHTARLVKLARNAELAPALGPFVDDLLKSAESFRRQPQRLEAWTKQLADADESQRAQAAVALIRAGSAAVAPLVAVLADPQRAAEHPLARRVVLRIGDSAIAPLLGDLESGNAAIKAQAIDLLGELRATDAVSQLLGVYLVKTNSPALRAAAGAALAHINGQAIGEPEALRALEQAAQRAIEMARSPDTEPSSRVQLWHWNPERGQSVSVTYDRAGAALAQAARYARALYQIDPHSDAYRRLYLISLLTAAKSRSGFDKPLPTGEGTARALAGKMGVETLEDVLMFAMAQGYLPAAAAAAECLADVGTADLLSRHGGESPLVLAARNGDRRLRFAAIDAILRLRPLTPFAGSSQVAENLAFFSSSYGTPRVLVVHPLSAEAQRMTGLLAGLGYDTDIATNGRRAFELAVRSADYDFILIHSAIDRPAADDLLAQLRRDRRTANVPVGLVAPLEDLERVEQFAAKIPRTIAFLQPLDEPQMQIFNDQLLTLAGPGRVSAEERKLQASAALDWLVALSQQPRGAFDLTRFEDAVENVLYIAELSGRATAVLGQLGTARSQRNLLQMANLATQPIEARRAAVAALTKSFARYGKRLSSEEIRRQYDLYNANGGHDADAGEVFGAILDALEGSAVADAK